MAKEITYKKIANGEYEKTERFDQKSNIKLVNLDIEIQDRKSDKKVIEEEIKRLQNLKKKLEAIS